MTTQPTPESILRDIAQIQRMDLGSVSVIRQGPARSYYNHQCYGTFRKQGYFIGSGVIEAGGKTVIGSRCKQSGMFWSVPGVNHILALRCIHASRRLDSFWKYRLNEQAAHNDALPLAA